MLNFHDLSLDTHEGFINSLHSYLPRPAWRDFCVWGLSEENPAQAKFAGLLGLPQLTALMVYLLGDCVPTESAQIMGIYSIPLGNYLTWEVISDNLAIGLAHRDPSDDTFHTRRELLLRFNQAMIDVLNGAQDVSLDAEFSLAEQISAFERSLSPEKYRTFAHHYLKTAMDVTQADLEFTVWDGLVANLKAASVLMNTLEDAAVYECVRQGLIRRYQAVSALLEDDHKTLQKQLELGADSILVVPTLAYCIGVMGEQVYGITNFELLVEDEMFQAALQKAAILVRMTNDVGTRLLLGKAKERDSLMVELREIYEQSPESYPSLRALIGAVAERFDPILTRLQKDIERGEFNLLLNGTDDMSVPDALTHMHTWLHEFAYLYQCHRMELSHLCNLLEDRFVVLELACILIRFVEFHEWLYSNSYQTAEGEYAV